MTPKQIAELRKVFGEPLEPEGWHDAKVLHLLDEYETLLAAALKADDILKRALYEEGYCEKTTTGELAGPPKGHAPGCYAGVNTGCNCWVGRARYLAPPPKIDTAEFCKWQSPSNGRCMRTLHHDGPHETLEREAP